MPSKLSPHSPWTALAHGLAAGSATGRWVSGSLAGARAELPKRARRAHWSRPLIRLRPAFATRRGAGGRGFEQEAVPPAVWHLFGLRFAELGTVTWHAQPGKPETTPVPAGGERAALTGWASTTTAAEADARAPWSVRNLEPPGAAAGVAGLNPRQVRRSPPLELAADDYASSLEAALGPWPTNRDQRSSPNTNRPAANCNNAISCAGGSERSCAGCRPVPPLLVKNRPTTSEERTRSKHPFGPPGLPQERPGRGDAVNTASDRLGPGEPPTDPDGRTAGRAEKAGGLSGAPLRARAQEVLRRWQRHTAGPALRLIRRGRDWIRAQAALGAEASSGAST